MDWRKEVKVSDLFGSGGRKQPTSPAQGETTPGAPTPAGPEASVWKKEIRLSGLFKRKRQTRPRGPLALPMPGSTVEDAPTPEASRLVSGAAVAAASQAEPVARAAAETESAPAGAPAPASGGVSDMPPPPAAAATTSAPAASSEPTPTVGQAAGKTNAPTPDTSQRRPQAEKPQRADGRGRRADKKLPAAPLMRSLNLLPQDVKLAKTTIRPAFAHVGVAFVALLVAGGLGAFYYTKNQDVLERKSTIEDKKAEIAAIKSVQPTEDDSGTELAGEALARATALSAAVQQQVGWDRLLRELSLTLPDEVWFDSVITATSSTPVVPVGGDASTATAAPTITTATSLSISGFAMDQERLAQLLARLEAIPSFSSVQLESADRIEVGSTNVIQFSVLGSLK
jgi:Tfp pilus assembly protein PilN